MSIPDQSTNRPDSLPSPRAVPAPDHPHWAGRRRALRPALAAGPQPSGPRRAGRDGRHQHLARKIATHARVILACPVCELSAGPYRSMAEALFLADRHDALHHRGRPTIEVNDTAVCESCRRAPATLVWTRPEAGAPFALCEACHPDHPAPRQPRPPRTRTRLAGA